MAPPKPDLQRPARRQFQQWTIKNQSRTSSCTPGSASSGLSQLECVAFDGADGFRQEAERRAAMGLFRQEYLLGGATSEVESASDCPETQLGAFQQGRLDSLRDQCRCAGESRERRAEDDTGGPAGGFYSFSIRQGLYLWIGVPVMGSLRSAEMSSFAFTPICSSSPVSLLVWTSPKPWGTETLPG